MIDKLIALPRLRATVFLLAMPTLICGGVLTLAVFAPDLFARWDYVRLFTIAAGITLPVLGLNMQLAGTAMFSILMPGLMATQKIEAEKWAKTGEHPSRSEVLADEATWLGVICATFFTVPVIYVPLVASVYTPMPLRRAVTWSLWAEGIGLVVQLILLIACVVLATVQVRANAAAAAEHEEQDEPTAA